MKQAFALLLFLGLALAGAGFMHILHLLDAPGPLTQEKIIYIPAGSSTRAIAEDLQNEGALSSPFLFICGAKINRAHGALRAGEYLFPAAASLNAVIGILQTGKVYQHHLTIPEGLTSAEVAALVNQAPALTGPLVKTPPEGSLLPETYDYTRGETRQSLIARMQKAMRDAVAALWAQHAPDIPYTTQEDAVILASIVEKETGVPQERPIIAGVFANRLRAGMPLQSDPTVIYVLTRGKGALGRRLTHKDLEIVSPYNTYLVRGLPPTPIANPGRAALEAAMAPQKTDAYYFVADGSGGHAFAATLKDQSRNVEKWRAFKKNRQ